MNRISYLIIATIAFTIAFIPDMLSTILQKRILIDRIPRTTIKTGLIFLICIMESTLIKKQIPGILGWILTVLLGLGFIGKIIHFMGNIESIILSTILIIGINVFYAYQEKNKSLIHYLLLLFVVIRVTIIVWKPYSEFLWWCDLISGTTISVYGIIYLLYEAKILQRRV